MNYKHIYYMHIYYIHIYYIHIYYIHIYYKHCIYFIILFPEFVDDDQSRNQQWSPNRPSKTASCNNLEMDRADHAELYPKRLENPKLRTIIRTQAVVLAKADKYGSFTSIIVDNFKNADYPVIFIGTDQGYVLKVAEFKQPKNGNKFQLVDAFAAFDALDESCKCDDPTSKCVEVKPERRVIRKIEIQYIDDKPVVHAAFSKCLISIPARSCESSPCCQK